MRRWLLDTGVWLAHIEGSRLSVFLERLVGDEHHRIFTSAITVAELTSVMVRRGRGEDAPDRLRLVRRSSEVLPLGEDILELAGRIHAEERSRHRDFSLADSLILAHAKEYAATLLTTDRSLAKNRQGVRARLL